LIYPINLTASEMYQPDPYAGDVDLFQPSGSPANEQSIEIWRERTLGSLRVHSVDAGHLDLLGPAKRPGHCRSPHRLLGRPIVGGEPTVSRGTDIAPQSDRRVTSANLRRKHE